MIEITNDLKEHLASVKEPDVGGFAGLPNLNEGDSFSVDEKGFIHRHSPSPNDNWDKGQED